MDLVKSIQIAASGMKAQGTRIRVSAQNMANANSVAPSPEEDPYRRKMVTFRSAMDRAAGVELVTVDAIRRDPSEFGRRYDPGHPAAGPDGHVRTPNVNSLIESMDLREAQRSYEANLSVIEQVKGMLSRTVDLLRV